MSSQIHRIQQAIDLATSFKRKIAFIGRSMVRNTQTAHRLGFLKFSKKNVVVNPKQLHKIPDNKLCLIIAGSQGQESSALTRFASNTHKFLKPKPTDSIIYSADIIPGNESAVYRVIDQLAQAGAYVAHGELIDDLHASGHASASELQLLIELVNPQYLYPIGGSFRHMHQYQRLAQQLGYRQEQVILPRAGQIIELSSSGKLRLAETLTLKEVRFQRP
jgi:ribonuclease J